MVVIIVVIVDVVVVVVVVVLVVVVVAAYAMNVILTSTALATACAYAVIGEDDSVISQVFMSSGNKGRYIYVQARRSDEGPNRRFPKKKHFLRIILILLLNFHCNRQNQRLQIFKSPKSLCVRCTNQIPISNKNAYFMINYPIRTQYTAQCNALMMLI